jgi:hypothetical protein
MDLFKKLALPAVFSKVALPGAAAPFGRSAGVLGAMAILAMFGALLGGGGGSTMSPEEAAAEVMATATSEPTVEATAEHAVEPTAEATAEHAVEPTAEPTVEATPEATPTEAPLFTVKATPTAEPTAEPDPPQFAAFVSMNHGVAFEYEIAPDGFVLSHVATSDTELVMEWSLARQSEIAASAAHEFGPRGMTIDVLIPDPFPADAEAWVRESPRSNLGLGDGELTAATVGGARGVRYAWSGAHEAVSVAVQFDGKIWLLTATYGDDFAEIERAFEALLESVVFGK